MTPGLENCIVDRDAYQRNVEHLHKRNVVLPKISELADPVQNLSSKSRTLADVDPGAADPGNLFRVHWHNTEDRTDLAMVPQHLVLDENLTGVKCKIVVALGNRFPMIDCHKVLAAYGCLIPRLMSGVFDATRHRAVWPSTGNYCRGGVAIANLLGCRSVAVLPEGMSQERFNWLNQWLSDPCHDLAQNNENLILNQFAEYGNYIIHRSVTGPSLERIFHSLNQSGKLKARAFLAATGSAGTIAAGDHLKASLGSQIGAIESTECPTLLYNGYGEHNIQGIGDKHVPLIHNVMNSDFIIGVSDRATDGLSMVFNTAPGHDYLSNYRGLNQKSIANLHNLGFSSLANIIGAIKYAKYMDLGSDDVVMTVATDDAGLYQTELTSIEKKYYANGFDSIRAAETFGRSILGVSTDHMIEMTRPDRERVFNLGYYTWVEQQGTTLENFDRRRDQAFWDSLLELVPVWDGMIEKFNQ